jgi:hypothetical protein
MAVDWERLVVAPLVKVFGEDSPALYIPLDASVAPYPITPVFDEAYREIILLDMSSPTSDAMPVAGINDSQFTIPPVQNDRIRIARTMVTYLVKEVRADGHGHTKLMLAKTDPYP